MPPNPLAKPFAPPIPPSSMPTLPALPELSAFLQSHLPQLSPLASAAEVNWLYHTPHYPRTKKPPYDSNGNDHHSLAPSLVLRLVLSITPTEGVYTSLALPASNQRQGELQQKDPTHPSTPKSKPLNRSQPETQAVFLHRPWTLNRARLPRSTAVWASHKAFDDGLTVGCNFSLMGRLLGREVEDGRERVLVGYKGDEGRRVGVVVEGGGVGTGELKDRVRREFGRFEDEGGAWFGDWEQGSETVRAIACMNAFHPEEVERVTLAAVEAGWAESVENCSGVVYLTGAVREEGLKAAQEKGMRVVCVGHRVCEAWGVRFLAEKVREQWPGLDVRVVDEKEAIVPRKRKGDGEVKCEKQEKEKETAMLGEEKRRRASGEEEEDGGVAL